MAAEQVSPGNLGPDSFPGHHLKVCGFCNGKGLLFCTGHNGFSQGVLAFGFSRGCS